jgi:hypothetical protein
MVSLFADPILDVALPFVFFMDKGFAPGFASQ